MKKETLNDLLKFLENNPVTTDVDISDKYGMPKATIWLHAKKLENDGLVDRVIMGINEFYSITVKGAEFIASGGYSSDDLRKASNALSIPAPINAPDKTKKKLLTHFVVWSKDNPATAWLIGVLGLAVLTTVLGVWLAHRWPLWFPIE